MFISCIHESQVSALSLNGVSTNIRFFLTSFSRWDTGQDLTHAIARKLKLYLGAMRIWLDVDDLSSTDDLESWVQNSSAILIVYTKGYFESWNCRREFFQALQFKKPIILVYNSDNSKISEIVNDCADNCNLEGIKEIVVNRSKISSQKSLEGDQNDQESLFASNRSSTQINDSYDVNEIYNQVKDFISRCNNENYPIEWLKVGKFSLESLKLIYYRALQELPFYKTHRYLLDKGLCLPEEVNPKSLHGLIKSLPSVNLVFPGIFERNNMVEDLRTLCLLEFEGTLTLVFDETPIESQKEESEDYPKTLSVKMISKKQESEKEVAILYLNNHTFSSHPTYNIREEIENLMERKTPIFLVHEKDPQEGGCAFVFKEELQNMGFTSAKAQVLFKDIAIPLYKRSEYRKVSLQLILEKILKSAKQQTSNTISLKKCFKAVHIPRDRNPSSN